MLSLFLGSVPGCMWRHPPYCSKLLFLPLQLFHVLSLAGWNAVFSLDKEGCVLTFCPLRHYYAVSPGGRWARDFPCCVHCQATVGRKSPAETWEHKGWFRISRSLLGTTWQRLSRGKAVLSACGFLLAPRVAAGCTRALLWELSPSSAPPCLFGSVLCKKHSPSAVPALPRSTSYPASPSLCFLAQSAS